VGTSTSKVCEVRCEVIDRGVQETIGVNCLNLLSHLITLVAINV
jgi:hypothetical protein